MEEFPKYNIGVVNTVDETYDVHWLGDDLAEVTLNGDRVVDFASAFSVGFVSVEDVLEQAADIMFEMETFGV